MSNKKHKGDHARRAERRAARAKSAPVFDPATAEKPRRVYLRNRLYILLTLLVVVGVIALLVVFQLLGWWDNLFGSIAAVLVGGFGVMCVYDLGLLLTACLTFGEGMVNAGKDESGALMVFHAASVERLEVRDKSGAALPEGQAVYKSIDLTFVMQSGRVNRRHLARLTQKQYEAIKAALEAERGLDLQA